MNTNLQVTCDIIHDNHLYAYADETSYIARTSEEYSLVGYGIFITPEKEINWLPDSSSRSCSSMHEDGKYSKCNLNNNFHATDDCHSVRSSVIEAINKNACGIFIFCYAFTNGKPTDEVKKDIWNKSLSWLYQTEFITSLFVEKRGIDISDQTFDVILLTLKNQLLYTRPDQEPNPIICKPLHKINNIRLEDKSCPGITIVDYLTWVYQRKISRLCANDFDKFKWTDNVTCDMHNISNGPSILSRYLGNYSKKIRYCYPFDHSTTSYDNYKIKSLNGLLASYLEIERIVGNVISYDSTILRHLGYDYNKYREYKETNHHYNIIIQACKIFLWSCDTLPVWHDIDKSNIPRWHLFLQLKYVALYLCKNNIEVKVHLAYLSRYRASYNSK
ncbi:MAG: hypothetical protein LW807_06445 [Proteobacteria bacterium]|jgi:hypothetical protein|nr:hypothetical protein [Pseudomonadota bacterium]